MAELHRSIRVISKRQIEAAEVATGENGTVIEAKGGAVTVAWDNGRTSVCRASDLVQKGRGRQPGDGRMQPKEPAKSVSIDRRLKDVVEREMGKLNLSQRALAERTGMSRRTIQRIIKTNGHKQRIETLEALATALGLSPARFWDVTLEAR